MRTFIRSTCIVLFLYAQAAQSKIAGESIEELIQSSDAVVIATVTQVSEASPSAAGIRFASAETKRTLKGPLLGTVRFRASKEWVCDISDAQIGETVLLFLVGPTDGNFGIALAGRGYMPLRTVHGKKYATLWDDVRLPRDAPVIPGPNPKYTFIVSVELSYIEALVRNHRAPAAQPSNPLERTPVSVGGPSARVTIEFARASRVDRMHGAAQRER